MDVDNHRKSSRAKEIREALLASVESHPKDLLTFVAAKFSVSRQAVHRQVQRLVGSGDLTVEGDRRHARYRPTRIEKTAHIKLEGSLEEDRLWESFAMPLFSGVKPNVLAACAHGFTEMVNNVIDHSGATYLSVGIVKTKHDVELTVSDDGVGIFRKIQKACGLDNPEQALFELSKGKLTTDPTRHSGEGIFFTSRIFDRFSILSGGLWFGHHREETDWLLNDFKDRPGTAVFMNIALDSDHTVQEVFDAYSTTRDGMTFDKTVVALSLENSGPLVSRSQAKRVVSRLNAFKEVVLDFKNVPEIGQAFADEIFRVYKIANPGVSLTHVNTNEGIERMISRATVAARREAVRASSLGVILRELLARPEFADLTDADKWKEFRAGVAAREPSSLAGFDSLPVELRAGALGVLLDLAKEGTEP